MADQPQRQSQGIVATLEHFWQEAATIIDRLLATQGDAIRKGAALLAQRIEEGGVIHVFGSGHSRAFAMELCYRAGGLVPFNRIDLEDLALYADWPLAVVKDLDIERNLDAGKQLLSCYQIDPRDAFIITSQSGVNSAIIECALQVKERGLPLVTVTALEHTTQVPIRHPSGKRLFELGDVVIDNCGPYGDALLDLPSGGKASSVSSITGALIAQMLATEIIGKLIADGQEPPVFISANVPGGIERNQQLKQLYQGRVRW